MIKINIFRNLQFSQRLIKKAVELDEPKIVLKILESHDPST